MKQFVLLTALLLAACAAAFAQGEAISKAEFDSIHNNSTYPQMRWNGQSFRAVIMTETSSSIGKQFDYSSKYTTEYGPNGAVRSLHESRMGTGDVKQSETVKVDDVTFVRSGSGAWVRKATTGSANPADEIPRPASHHIGGEAEYRYLGTEDFRGKPAKVYLKIEKRKVVDTKTGAEGTSTSKTKYWFDADGTLLKSVFKSDSKRGDVTSQTGVIMEYELDPGIKITAPVLSSEK
jgi:hypothetical protein